MLCRGVGGLYVNGVVARYQRSGTPAAAISLRGDQTWDRYENGLMGIHSIYFTDNDQIFQEGPATGSPIASGGLTDFSIFPTALQQAAAGFVTPTAYRGAADPDGARWWEGWTYYAQN